MFNTIINELSALSEGIVESSLLSGFKWKADVTKVPVTSDVIGTGSYLDYSRQRNKQQVIMKD